MEQYDYLEKIYVRQHYFIDRHDSMAEKYISILLVELTCVSFVFAFLGMPLLGNNLCYMLFLLSYLILFVFVLFNLLRIIRPLSSKAKKSGDESLLNEEDKKWILESSYYYQGILKQIRKAQNDDKFPTEEYLKTINSNYLSIDLVRQIFILAQYNDYKKRRLEKATHWMVVTAIVALVSVSFPIVQQCFVVLINFLSK